MQQIIAKRLSLFVILFAMLMPFSDARASENKVHVTGVGFVAGGDVAAARDRAIRDAHLRALEQAAGVHIDARTVLHKTLLIDDTVLTQTRGVIRSYTILEEGLDAFGLYRVSLEAVVDSDRMTEALVRQAGEKKILAVMGGKGQDPANGDRVLLERVARGFSNAGFSMKETVLSESDFRLLNPDRIIRLCGQADADLALLLKLDVADQMCPVDNYCAAAAHGALRLYSGKTGERLSLAEKKDVRGFANTAAAARTAALNRAAELLLQDMMSGLFHRQVRDVRVCFLKVPDHRTYAGLQRSLSVMRWVISVKADAVGYHPEKSVFEVQFAQDTDLLSGMLRKLTGYAFLGREGTVFTLRSIK